LNYHLSIRQIGFLFAISKKIFMQLWTEKSRFHAFAVAVQLLEGRNACIPDYRPDVQCHFLRNGRKREEWLTIWNRDPRNGMSAAASCYHLPS
jgi:hypothetical protein